MSFEGSDEQDAKSQLMLIEDEESKTVQEISECIEDIDNNEFGAKILNSQTKILQERLVALKKKHEVLTKLLKDRYPSFE